jgi:predicted kinase
LILICGLPGAGRTTLARWLAHDVPAIRLGADEWMAGQGIDLHDQRTRGREDARTRGRLELLLWELAQDLLRLGISVILEFG